MCARLAAIWWGRLTHIPPEPSFIECCQRALPPPERSPHDVVGGPCCPPARTHAPFFWPSLMWWPPLMTSVMSRASVPSHTDTVMPGKMPNRLGLCARGGGQGVVGRGSGKEVGVLWVDAAPLTCASLYHVRGAQGQGAPPASQLAAAPPLSPRPTHGRQETHQKNCCSDRLLVPSAARTRGARGEPRTGERG